MTAARSALAADARGGLTAGLLALVTTLAYATVIGVAIGADMTSPAALSGLIGAGVGGVVATLLAPIGVQVHSPRASVVVLVAAAGSAIAAQLGPGASAQTLAWLSACLLLAGLLQAAFGVLRLGALIRLVPHCVSAGFTLGIAAALAWSQRDALWPPAAGADASAAALFAPAAVALFTLACIAGVQRQRRWAPLRAWSMPLGFALAFVPAQALQSAAPGLLPRLAPIDLGTTAFVSLARVFDLGDTDASRAVAVLPHVLFYALVIAFVNALETLTCSLMLEARLQQRFDPNRSLLASAAGSLAAVCVGGLPVAGSAATSAANLDAGGHSRRSALIAAGVIALLAVAGHAALAWVPLAALVGVTLAVALALARQPLRELLRPCVAVQAPGRRPCGELAIGALVALLVPTAGSAVALPCGVVAAALLTVARMRRGVVQRQYGARDARVGKTHGSDDAARQIRIVEVGQPLHFANVEPVVQAVEAQAPPVRFVVVDLTRASAVDASAARSLAGCQKALAGARRTLLIVHAAGRAAAPAGFDGCLVFDSVGDAVAHATRALAARAHATAATAETSESETERATRLLLPHVGPIAPILVARAARACGSGSDALYRQLSSHVPTPDACRAFLRAAGHPELAPAGAPR